MFYDFIAFNVVSHPESHQSEMDGKQIYLYYVYILCEAPFFFFITFANFSLF